MSPVPCPPVREGRSKVAAMREGLAELTVGLKFDHVTTAKGQAELDELALKEEGEEESPRNVSVAINRLVSFVKTIMAKVHDHGRMIKFIQKTLDQKPDLEELEKLQQRNVELELHCDEIQQHPLLPKPPREAVPLQAHHGPGR